MKILYIEDEENLRKPVKKFLEKRKFLVEEAEDGNQALSLIHINNYDCILLDLNLPEIDGISLMKKIRSEGVTTPVIMVTARSQIYNKLEGFEAGTDDYLTKPFDLNELVARIEAVIKRNATNKTLSLVCGDWTILKEQNKAINTNGKAIQLTNKEIEILEYLIRMKGQTVSSENLLEHIWGSDSFFSQTVKTHVKSIRKKLDPKKEHILNIKGKGYFIK